MNIGPSGVFNGRRSGPLVRSGTRPHLDADASAGGAGEDEEDDYNHEINLKAWMGTAFLPFCAYVVADVLCILYLPLPSFGSKSSDSSSTTTADPNADDQNYWMLFGWITHFVGVLIYVCTTLVFCLRQTPFNAAVLLGYFGTLTIMTISSVLFSQQRIASEMIHPFYNNATTAVQLQWVATVFMYAYVIALIYHAPTSGSGAKRHRNALASGTAPTIKIADLINKMGGSSRQLPGMSPPPRPQSSAANGAGQSGSPPTGPGFSGGAGADEHQMSGSVPIGISPPTQGTASFRAGGGAGQGTASFRAGTGHRRDGSTGLTSQRRKANAFAAALAAASPPGPANGADSNTQVTGMDGASPPTHHHHTASMNNTYGTPNQRRASHSRSRNSRHSLPQVQLANGTGAGGAPPQSFAPHLAAGSLFVPHQLSTIPPTPMGNTALLPFPAAAGASQHAQQPLSSHVSIGVGLPPVQAGVDDIPLPPLDDVLGTANQ